MTHAQWDLLADASNPALLGIFLVSVVRRFGGLRAARGFLAAFWLALGLTYVLSHLPQWLHWWPDLGDFPSGHMTFLLTITTSFFLLDRRSLVFTIPFAVLYGWLIVFLGYHTWFDLFAALLLAVPVTWLCHRLVPGGREGGSEGMPGSGLGRETLRRFPK